MASMLMKMDEWHNKSVTKTMDKIIAEALKGLVEISCFDSR